ncbi:MAG: hypothetical protein H7222_12940 [Methylotenera sp.]|nr:hypothetical protein [Oligoflexia bacterium]
MKILPNRFLLILCAISLLQAGISPSTLAQVVINPASDAQKKSTASDPGRMKARLQDRIGSTKSANRNELGKKLKEVQNLKLMPGIPIESPSRDPSNDVRSAQEAHERDINEPDESESIRIIEERAARRNSSASDATGALKH